MNEPLFAGKIRQVLNQGTELGSGTLDRLKQAREIALKRHRATEPVAGLAWADELMTTFGGFAGVSLRLVLPIVVLIGGLLAIGTWQTNQRSAEMEEIDALLLTDDLPLDAYLDKGFEAWLKKRSPL
jgi:hypothetical protein